MRDVEIYSRQLKLENVSIAEPLQNRQHAPLMLSTLGSKEKRAVSYTHLTLPTILRV